MTDELLQDSTALTAIASQAFSEEIMFMTEDAIVEGTGAGQPLGYLNAGP
jgi:HK97 family phage major capsid protein